MTRLPDFHAAKWDEPLIYEIGRAGAPHAGGGAAEPTWGCCTNLSGEAI